ncbi:hypothetical protein [Methyloglobulus sp.]|uniref:hypothetical protein n=1 Tax=Methyloglobulus sp. TaxID=2518622 RepID=UPI0032B82075
MKPSLVIVALFICAKSITAFPFELNQRTHIAPQQHAKVNNVIARSYIQGAETKYDSPTTSQSQRSPSQSVQIGGGNRPSITVIRGDVIAVNKRR